MIIAIPAVKASPRITAKYGEKRRGGGGAGAPSASSRFISAFLTRWARRCAVRSAQIAGISVSPKRITWIVPTVSFGAVSSRESMRGKGGGPTKQSFSSAREKRED